MRGPTCGRGRGHRAVEDEPQAGHRERLDRPHLQRLVHMELVEQQSQRAPDARPQCEVPLRIFDRNQGEKQRTLIDIDRNQQLTDAARAQVFSDVDSAYEQVRSNIALLEPYSDQYRTRPRGCATP